MGKIFIVTKNILRRMFRKPSNYLLHIVLPVVVSIVIFTVFSSEDSIGIKIAIVDLDDTRVSQSITEQIDSNEKFKVIKAEEAEISSMISSGDVSLGLVINSGFENNILNNKIPMIDIISIGENEGTGWIKSITNYHIENIVNMATAVEYDEQALYAMIDAANEGEITLVGKFIEDITLSKSVTLSTIGIYMMVLMMSTLLTSFQILDEKRLGTFARIGMAPVPAKIYTISNILANLLIVMVQMTVVLFVLTVVMKSQLFMHPAILFIILICFSLSGISLGVMTASLARNVEQSSAIMSLVLSPSCMIAGCFWPIAWMPKVLQNIAYITPQRWTMIAVETMQANGSFVDILPDILVLLGFSTLFFLVAAYVFKHKERKVA